MLKIVGIALPCLIFSLVPGLAHAQAKLGGDYVSQTTCAQLYAYFSPQSAETKAIRDALLADRSFETGPSLDEKIASGVSLLRQREQQAASNVALFRDSLAVCEGMTGMKAPAVSVVVALPAADRSLTRCAALLHVYDILQKEPVGPGAMRLIELIAAERGSEVTTEIQITKAIAEEIVKRGVEGTTPEALVAEGLACVDKYQVLPPLVLIMEADSRHVPGGEQARTVFCKYEYSYFLINYPRPDKFIDEIRYRHRDDAREFILEKGYGNINRYRHPMQQAKCPAVWMDPIDAREMEFTAALNAYAAEFNASVADDVKAGRATLVDPAH